MGDIGAVAEEVDLGLDAEGASFEVDALEIAVVAIEDGRADKEEMGAGPAAEGEVEGADSAELVLAGGDLGGVDDAEGLLGEEPGRDGDLRGRWGRG